MKLLRLLWNDFVRFWRSNIFFVGYMVVSTSFGLTIFGGVALVGILLHDADIHWAWACLLIPFAWWVVSRGTHWLCKTTIRLELRLTGELP